MKQANAKIHASSISLIRKLLQIGKQEEGNKKKRWLACFFFFPNNDKRSLKPTQRTINF
jgi:hypothetical protein